MIKLYKLILQLQKYDFYVLMDENNNSRYRIHIKKIVKKKIFFKTAYEIVDCLEFHGDYDQVLSKVRNFYYDNILNVNEEL